MNKLKTTLIPTGLILSSIIGVNLIMNPSTNNIKESKNEITTHTSSSDYIIKETSSGFNSTAAIVTAPDGDHLYTWGDNTYGQLGFGAPTSNNQILTTPTEVDLPEDTIKFVEMGEKTAFAVTTDNNNNDHLYAWGSNDKGQLGIDQSSTGIFGVEKVPFTLFNQLEINTIEQISIGHDHTLALVSSDQTGFDYIFGWGSNSFHQIRNAAEGSFDSPTIIAGTGNMDYYDPEIWGTTTFENSVFESVQAANQISGIVVGDATIDEDDVLYTWGQNFSGDLGLGIGTANTNIATPTAVKVDEKDKYKIVDFELSDENGFLIIVDKENDTQLYSWGSNDFGSLGLDTFDPYRNTPQLVSEGLPSVRDRELIDVEIKEYTGMLTLLNKSDPNNAFEEVYVWGSDNVNKNLLEGTGDKTSPTLLPGVNNLKSFSVGDENISAITTDSNGVDHLFVTGSNSTGSYGNGITNNADDLDGGESLLLPTVSMKSGQEIVSNTSITIYLEINAPDNYVVKNVKIYNDENGTLEDTLHGEFIGNNRNPSVVINELTDATTYSNLYAQVEFEDGGIIKGDLPDLTTIPSSTAAPPEIVLATVDPIQQQLSYNILIPETIAPAAETVVSKIEVTDGINSYGSVDNPATPQGVMRLSLTKGEIYSNLNFIVTYNDENKISQNLETFVVPKDDPVAPIVNSIEINIDEEQLSYDISLPETVSTIEETIINSIVVTNGDKVFGSIEATQNSPIPEKGTIKLKLKGSKVYYGLYLQVNYNDDGIVTMDIPTFETPFNFLGIWIFLGIVLFLSLLIPIIVLIILYNKKNKGLNNPKLNIK